jgi:thiamine-monophosphate kinase
MLGHDALAAGQAASPHAEAYLRPRALLREGQALRGHVTAMIDVSDGLVADASALAAASGCGCTLALADVPVPAGCEGNDERGPDARLRLACWGDDYQLLFALPAAAVPPVPATRIGRFEAGAGLSLDWHGAPVPMPDVPGFAH